MRRRRPSVTERPRTEREPLPTDRARGPDARRLRGARALGKLDAIHVINLDVVGSTIPTPVARHFVGFSPDEVTGRVAVRDSQPTWERLT